MSSERRPVVRTLIVLAIGAFALSVAYCGAWFYTSSYANLTPEGWWPSRSSPAPFVVVEKTGGEASATLATGAVVARPFESTRVLLWCAGHEVEVMSHMEYR